MLKEINAINSVVKTVLALVILAVLGAGGWFAYDNYFA